MTSQIKPASFTFMRANPPTAGHVKVVNHVIAHAAANHGSPHIFLSHTQDSKKNPLSHSQKVHFLSKMAPGAHYHTESSIKTPIDALEHLHKRGHTHVTMFVGADRHQEMNNLAHKYYGDKFKHLEVKSAGDRDPDAEGVTGISGTKMREHAAKRDFASFKKGVAKPEYAKALYQATRKGLKLEAYQALFLVGGPGSGKDLILREALSGMGAREIPLGAQTPLNGMPLIINGNAHMREEVILEANELQSHGYSVAMIYVYTSDEASRQRNEARIQKGAKTITEATRAAKYSESIANLHEFKGLFGQAFFLFDNSHHPSDPQTQAWLDELQEAVSSHFSENIYRLNKKHGVHTGPGDCPECDGTGDDKDGHECVACDGSGHTSELGAHNVDDQQNTQESLELDALFEKTYPTMIDMIASKGPKKDADKYKGGIAVAGAKSTQQTMATGQTESLNNGHPTYHTGYSIQPGHKVKFQDHEGNIEHGEVHRAYGTEVGITVPGKGRIVVSPNMVHHQVESTNQEITVPQTQAKGVKFSKNRPAKGAKPPNDSFDSRMGAVPSGSLGLSTSIGESTKAKLFSAIRKR